jgi:predicted unusual protein kinase regulating ubiquinone biosynthesis (AarF/ABC1/UbiB family)
MSLAFRLLRALTLFGVIFASYMLQLGLVRALGRREVDDAGKKRARVPAWLKRRRERVDKRNARRLLRGMLRLRGVFIKLGQVLSILGGFLPRAFTSELEQLQDRVPPQPFRYVERTFLASYAKRPEQCFKSIEREPVAAASLGQVHVAYLNDGTKVAVKVLYPQVRDVIRIDMRVLKLVIKVLKRFVPLKQLDHVHRSLVDLLRRETDYVHEAACMERMAKNFSGESDILFPSVVKEWSNGEILTMTFMEGIKITRFEELEKAGIDRRKLATRMVESFYKQLFVDRFFHADPHPGNFLVQPGPSGAEGDRVQGEPGAPRIVVLDFGAISEVGPELVEGALEILSGIFTESGDLVLGGFRKMGFVSEEGNKKLLEETVIRYFKKLLKVKDRTAAALVRAERKDLEKLADPGVEREELRELMRSIAYPEGWFYVERASVMMFWLCGQIDPTLDTMSVGIPYVMPLVMQKQNAAAGAAV